LNRPPDTYTASQVCRPEEWLWINSCGKNGN